MANGKKLIGTANPEHSAKTVAGTERRVARMEEIREICERYQDEQTWDSILAKDLDPSLIDWVQNKFEHGWQGSQICHALGFKGTGSKQWKKILAFFRQGMRADAEVYLYRETHKFFSVIQKAKAVLEDAFENGTPITAFDEKGNAHTVRVKGATKELGSFLESYSKAVAHPVKLWKDFGAIGEKKEGLGNSGITIVVKTNVPSPSQADVDAYRNKLKELPVIEVEGKDVEPKK